MYRKDSKGWLKHADFILLDMLCLQIAFILAHKLSGYSINIYSQLLYRHMAVFMELADLLVIFAYGSFNGVLKRGHYKEFVITIQHTFFVGASALFYLFLFQEGQNFSRSTLILTFVGY